MDWNIACCDDETKVAIRLWVLPFDIQGLIDFPFSSTQSLHSQCDLDSAALC